MPAFHAIVEGRVQGVGFRWFVIHEAQLLGLTGEVRNLSNGRAVEVIAEGKRDVLDHFLDRLREGPVMSRVSDVKVDWLDDDNRFDSFQVSY